MIWFALAVTESEPKVVEMPEIVPKNKTKLPTQQDVISEPQSVPSGSESATSIPEEVLQIPAIYALLHGAPPAVYAEKNRKDPEIATVVKNQKPLLDAGFGFYPSKDGTLTVLYNGAYVTDEQLKQADDAGQLTQVVPSFDSVKKSFDSAISGTPPEPGAAPGVVAGPPAGGAPASSKTQNTLATARTKNLQVGSPTSGPVPGRGRILNNILKPTI